MFSAIFVGTEPEVPAVQWKNGTNCFTVYSPRRKMKQVLLYQYDTCSGYSLASGPTAWIVLTIASHRVFSEFF